MSPQLIETLVCGQKYQSMFQVQLPEAFIGRFFVDVYRSFLARHVRSYFD